MFEDRIQDDFAFLITYSHRSAYACVRTARLQATFGEDLRTYHYEGSVYEDRGGEHFRPINGEPSPLIIDLNARRWRCLSSASSPIPNSTHFVL